MSRSAILGCAVETLALIITFILFGGPILALWLRLTMLRRKER